MGKRLTQQQARDRAFKASETVFERGYEARLSGTPRDQCPYPDHRTWQGKLTFSRAWRNLWHDGWDAANRVLARDAK